MSKTLDDKESRNARDEMPHCLNRLTSDDVKLNIIERLMQMEARTNQEMTARYRNSVITSSLDNLRNGAIGDSSAFTQPCRACTVDDLNELSRTTLVLMVSMQFKVRRRKINRDFILKFEICGMECLRHV